MEKSCKCQVLQIYLEMMSCVESIWPSIDLNSLFFDGSAPGLRRVSVWVVACSFQTSEQASLQIVVDRRGGAMQPQLEGKGALPSKPKPSPWLRLEKTYKNKLP